MTDSQEKHNAPESPDRFEGLLNAIRDALAHDAGPGLRSAGAVACEAILGVLDPISRARMSTGSPPPASTSPAMMPPLTTLLRAIQQTPGTAVPASASPIAALVGAIGQIPRDQLLDFIGGLRSLTSQAGPTYRAAPTPPPGRPASGSEGGS